MKLRKQSFFPSPVQWFYITDLRGVSLKLQQYVRRTRRCVQNMTGTPYCAGEAEQGFLIW